MAREDATADPKSRTASERVPNSFDAATGPAADDYVIGPFRLRADVRALFHGAEPMPLSRRAVALLHVMVDRHGELVSKDALMDAAWSGQIVEESNLTVQIASLRRVLGTEPGGERWVETLPRRGYRYVGPAPVLDSGRGADALVPAGAVPAGQPTIVVVPFQNLNGDPQQSYIGEGFAEDITAALSRLKWLVVIARTGAGFERAVARPAMPETRARYILAGSTRLVGERIRISCRVDDT